MKKIICCAFILTILSVVSTEIFANYKDKIIERIAPIGSICMKGNSCAKAKVVTNTGPRDGLAIYNTGCLACHTPGVGGAPKLGDTAEWSERIKKGVEILYNNASNGIGTMPAKGICTNCSVDEINAAVDYIVAQSQ